MERVLYIGHMLALIGVTRKRMIIILSERIKVFTEKTLDLNL